MTKHPDIIVASADRCTVHPRHVMVDHGYSVQHYGHIYRCECGKWRLSKTDEDEAYPYAQRLIDKDARARITARLRRWRA